jgi:hypothetical protein
VLRVYQVKYLRILNTESELPPINVMLNLLCVEEKRHNGELFIEILIKLENIVNVFASSKKIYDGKDQKEA